MTVKTGYGSKLRIGTGTGDSLPAPGSDTFNDIPKIIELTQPDATRDTQSYPVLDAAADLKISGGVTKGNVVVKYVRDFGNTYHDLLYTDGYAAAAVRRNWKTVHPDSGAEEFDFVGSVVSYKQDPIKKSDAIQVTVEIAPEGDITRTP